MTQNPATSPGRQALARFHVWRVIVALALVLAALGWWRRSTTQAERAQARRERYAAAYAQFGLIRAVERDTLIIAAVTDSLSKALGITLEGIDGYLRGLNPAHEEITLFWKDAARMSDSLVKLQFARMNIKETQDTLNGDSASLE